MFNLNKCKYTQDLKLLLIALLLSVIFILIPPFNDVPVRILFAILVIFFVPGYAFISALFPGKIDLTIIERFTLSIGFSIVIMVFTGFIINLSKWEFREESITVSLMLFTFIFILITYFSRKRLPENEQFVFSYRVFINSLNSNEDVDMAIEETKHQKLEDNKKFTTKSRKKVSSINKYTNEYSPQPKKEMVPPEIIKALIAALVISIIIAGAMFAYAKVTEEKEAFTTLYILGPDGKAENYPETFSTSGTISINLGIENYEHEDVVYVIQAKLDGDVLKEKKIALEHEEKWEQNWTLTPVKNKVGEQKLEFALYKENVSESAYRTVHLWVTQDSGSEPVSSEQEKEEITEFADFITLINPFMESDEGWRFDTTNNDAASGNYIDGAGIYSSRAYAINTTSESASEQFTSHSIQQEVRSKKTEDMVLSVYLKDTYTSARTEGETQYKQIFFNGDILWADGMGGNEGWQHIQAPVTVKKGSNILSFNIIVNRNQVAYPAELIIDEVSFLPLSELSPYRQDDYTVEFDLPVSKVLPLTPAAQENKFTVQWNGTDVGSGILYYDIEYSTDAINWKKLLSKTAETSTEFTGQKDVTYYFRSRATDKALNIEKEHLVPDTSTMVDSTPPEITLDITPNPTSESTSFTVESNEPLSEVVCSVSPHTFGGVENIVMKTTDNMIWTAKYTVAVNDYFDVEIYAKDYAGNTGYALDILSTDTSLEELTIVTDPEETSGDVTFTISSSIALEDVPELVVKDRSNEVLDTDLKSSEDNEYTFILKIEEDDDDISDGVARVTVTAKTVNAETLYEEETFVIDRVKPTIKSYTPDDGETINSNAPTIRASFSDDRSGIERDATILKVNGVDVTTNAERNYESILYNAEGLPYGENTMYLFIRDQAGNTNEKEWSFYISS